MYLSEVLLAHYGLKCSEYKYLDVVMLELNHHKSKPDPKRANGRMLTGLSTRILSEQHRL
jgi:hypothetical protein